jgi:iron complex outermembrane receptor protein
MPHGHNRLALLTLFAAITAWGQSSLADASLEQLLNTQVTSVSKKEEKLARTAASVFVINQDDIRHSGATNIPDLLRMVPGVEVAQINSNAWAVTIRGFNQRYSNKVLVLVDGRSVYAPGFSGVYWDQIDMPLEDIDRIEVIRGPGASVWGANAMNGVINIISKSSKATKGGLVSASGSTQGDASSMVRYGGDIGTGGSYRAFAKTSAYGSSQLPDSTPGHDAWSSLHSGFRSDWDLTPSDTLTVQGDLFSNRESETRSRWFITEPFDTPFAQNMDAAGGNLLARWTHTFANGSDTSVQTYYDQFQRNDPEQPDRERTLDIDFQHHLAVGSRQDIVWGLGYRSETTYLPTGYDITATPPRRVDPLYSAFFQDEIQIGSNVWLTLGSKIEHNAYTGFEYEPNARIAWAPDARQTLWASASKAIRQPSRLETGVSLELGSAPIGPGLAESVQLLSNPRFLSEQVRDYEVGYRRQWSKRVSLDADAFLSFYRNLATFEPQALVIVPGPVTVFQVPVMYGNKGRANDFGGEVSVNWSVSSRWRISPGYSLVHINYWLEPGSGDTFTVALAGNTPLNMVQIRSTINLTRRLEWDQTVYWSQAFANGTVPSHARLDSKLAWKAGESVELSLTGQNLLRPEFLEFGNFEEVVGTEAPRSLIGKIVWRF